MYNVTVGCRVAKKNQEERALGLGALKTLWEKGYQPAGAKLFLLTENLLHYAS